MGIHATLSAALLTVAVSQPVFAHTLQARTTIPEAQAAIDAFKAKISEDPHGVTKTWNDICAANATFSCSNNPFTNQFALDSFDVNGAQLKGDLTLDFMLELQDLVVFHANSNGFTGTVPKDLSGLQWLYEFDVSNNQLSGPFPEGVLTAKNLTYLDLRFNSFEGDVPSDVYKLNLDVLFLNDNLLTGTLADNIWDSTAIYITLDNNDFTGSIPEVSSKSKFNVMEFTAAGNRLTGNVPESLCNQQSLEYLNVTNNFLTGALGPKCTALVEAGVLDVSSNCLFNVDGQRALDSTECQLLINL